MKSFMTPDATRRWRAEYHPCENGVSIFQPEGGEFGGLTLMNFPGVGPDVFRKHSTAGFGDDDYDLIADHFVNGDLCDTIPIRRQDIAVIERAISSANELKEKDNG